jgi:hypothetical protein
LDPRNFTDTILYGVHTQNAHLVSEAFLRFVCTILCDHPDQDIDQIDFNPDGNPVIDGHEAFSTFDRKTLTITINLRRHFANAVRIAERGHTGLSMHAIIWSTMFGSVLRELKHALDARAAGYMDYLPWQEQERTADRWAAETKSIYARKGQTEMPSVGKEPYFGPLLTKFIFTITENHPPEWAQNQHKMIYTGIFYCDKRAGIEIHSMQEFYELSHQGLYGDEFGCHLNAVRKKEQELEDQSWQTEEMAELALNEAISAGRRVRIVHVDAGGSHFTQNLLPRHLSNKNYYLWLDALDENSSKLITIRVDRIQIVNFLS